MISSICCSISINFGATKTAEVLDAIKATGYKYSTRAAMTVAIADMTVPPQKPEMVKQAQDTVDLITKNYKRCLLYTSRCV